MLSRTFGKHARSRVCVVASFASQPVKILKNDTVRNAWFQLVRAILRLSYLVVNDLLVLLPAPETLAWAVCCIIVPRMFLSHRFIEFHRSCKEWICCCTVIRQIQYCLGWAAYYIQSIGIQSWQELRKDLKRGWVASRNKVILFRWGFFFWGFGKESISGRDPATLQRQCYFTASLEQANIDQACRCLLTVTEFET